MNGRPDAVDRRAQRLLRWYPASWRTRYGDEFTELLVADILDRPVSRTRTLDVARCGLLARLTAAGIACSEPMTAPRARARQATLFALVAVFLTFGLAVWSQLSVGWQRTPPDNPTTGLAMILMSLGALLLGTWTLAIPFVWEVFRLTLRGREWRLIVPGMLVLGCSLILLMGGRYFSAEWPGTGGHPWAGRGNVPGGVASLSWALTLWVTSYWAHPAALATFPITELAWMAVSPCITLGLVLGTARIVLCVDLPPRSVLFQSRLAPAAIASMLALLAGAGCWLAAGASRHRLLFHTGTIDIVSMTVMAVALAVTWKVVRAGAIDHSTATAEATPL